MYHWKPSQAQKEAYKTKMIAIDSFCKKNDIKQSSNGESYYFNIKGTNYRVSNHDIPQNSYYHSDCCGVNGLGKPDIDIRSSKLNIQDIYNNLKNK